MRLMQLLSRAPLVLEDLKTEAGGPFLLRARPGGLLAFLASLLKIGTVTEVTILQSQAEQATTNLSGESHVVLPLGAIESFATSFGRRPLWFVLALFALVAVPLAGLPWWIGLAAALVFLLAFALSRRLEVTLASGSGIISVHVRPSAGGLRVDRGVMQRIARSVGERIAEHVGRVP